MMIILYKYLSFVIYHILTCISLKINILKQTNIQTQVMFFKFDNRSIYSNIEIKSIKLVLLNVDLPCRAFVRIQQMHIVRVFLIKNKYYIYSRKQFWIPIS